MKVLTKRGGTADTARPRHKEGQLLMQSQRNRSTATIHYGKPCDGHTAAYFASLDGKHYIGVGRLPETDEDWQQVGTLIAGSGTLKPMTFSPSGIRMLGRLPGDTVEFDAGH